MSEQIEYHKFHRGEDCTYEGCPAKRYYIADGKRFCRFGHEQEGFRQVQEDEDDFNTQGRKTRKRREEKERVEKVFHGKQAAELFLQCFQLVLWKQVRWLVDVKGLPEELETVVRDLWAIKLRTVKVFGDERVEEESAGESNVRFSSQSEWETTGTDTEIWESATSGGETERRRRKAARSGGMPQLIDSLGLCYLGILLMRLPVGLGDLHGWVEREEILFLRVVREIPKDMRARLPAQYHAALESRSVLKRGDLYKAVSKLILSYKQKFELVFPSINAPLIFFKHIRDLCLPLDMYIAARRLGKIIQLDYCFPNIIGRNRITAYPEVQIISLIVIATKLCQPFDDIEQFPESIIDPSALKIDWGKWQEIMTEIPAKGFKRGEEVKVTDKDVFEMGGKKLDDYLDWYQRTWVDDSDPKLPQQILNLFPIEDLTPEDLASEYSESSFTDRLKRVSQSLMWQKPVPPQNGMEGPEINRPACLYRHYRTSTDLPDKAKFFYDKAAENAGLSVEMLVRAVYLMERELRKWMDAEKRRRTAETYGSDEAMDSDEL